MEDIRKPMLTHRDTEEDMRSLEKWCKELTDKLNYKFANIDETNLNESFKPVTREDMQDAIDKSEKQTMEYVTQKLKGAGL